MQRLPPDAPPIETAEILGVVIPARNEALDPAAARHSILAREGVDPSQAADAKLTD
jgi:hypothetical protein